MAWPKAAASVSSIIARALIPKGIRINHALEDEWTDEQVIPVAGGALLAGQEPVGTDGPTSSYHEPGKDCGGTE
jgi:hypothetical protein